MSLRVYRSNRRATINLSTFRILTYNRGGGTVLQAEGGVFDSR
jgi:hypothetical protein